MCHKFAESDKATWGHIHTDDIRANFHQYCRGPPINWQTVTARTSQATEINNNKKLQILIMV